MCRHLRSNTDSCSAIGARKDDWFLILMSLFGYGVYWSKTWKIIALHAAGDAFVALVDVDGEKNDGRSISDTRRKGSVNAGEKCVIPLEYSNHDCCKSFQRNVRCWPSCMWCILSTSKLGETGDLGTVSPSHCTAETFSQIIHLLSMHSSNRF